MRTANDRIEEMRIFVKIVELLSFTKAADALQLTTPTVSRVMRRLEERANLRLLNRSTRSVRPTPEGRLYYDGCVNLLRQLDSLDRCAAQAASVPEGRIRIALPASFAQHVLAPALPALFERYPLLDVDIVVSDGELNLVEAGVDCAIRVGGIRETSVVAREVGRVSEILCAAPAYLQRYPEPEFPDQLNEHRFVVGGASLSPAAEDADKPPVRCGPAHWVGTHDAAAYLACAIAGLGIARGYRFAFQPYLDTGALREILPACRRAPQPVRIVYYPSRRMSNRLRVFLDWLRDAMADALGEASFDGAGWQMTEAGDADMRRIAG